MYSDQVKLLATAMYDKKEMIKLSLNKINRALIRNETDWIVPFYGVFSGDLKVRCLLVNFDYDENSIPKCPNCGLPVSYDKEYRNSFNRFCSDKCSKEYGHLNPESAKFLHDREWLYSKRIDEKLSYDSIGKILNCSHVPVKRACVNFNIPEVKYNESCQTVTSKLSDYNWLHTEHKVNRKTCQAIADEIGSSKATVSLFLSKLGIESNPANSYEREIKSQSAEEKEMTDYIQSLGVSVEIGNRSILNGREIDVIVNDKNIAFEYNGLYSHYYRPENDSESSIRGKFYHLNKTLDAAKMGISLFHIFSDLWNNKNDIAKSIISAKLGIFTEKYFARKCEVRCIEKHEKSSFLNLNHAQGNDKSTYEYGLFHGEDLLAVMTFCKSRYNAKYDFELSRFAAKQHTLIIGGFSKLLAAFRKDHSGSIISYADRTLSQGNVYAKNGFTLINTNLPSYRYVNFKKHGEVRLHRANFMKHKISSGKDDPRTENEIMIELGYHKIFDCGTMAYGIS